MHNYCTYIYVYTWCCINSYVFNKSLCIWCFIYNTYVVLNAQLPPENPEEISTIVFPEDGDTQVTIPASAIIYQRNTEGIAIYH